MSNSLQPGWPTSGDSLLLPKIPLLHQGFQAMYTSDSSSVEMEPVMRKKPKRKLPSKPKSRKVESGSKGKPKTPSTNKDKEELIRIWNEDLCE